MTNTERAAEKYPIKTFSEEKETLQRQSYIKGLKDAAPEWIDATKYEPADAEPKLILYGNRNKPAIAFHTSEGWTLLNSSMGEVDVNWFMDIPPLETEAENG